MSLFMEELIFSFVKTSNYLCGCAVSTLILHRCADCADVRQ